MNLVIDQGNTVTKIALFDADAHIETLLFEVFDVDVCSSILSTYSISKGVYCTVVDPRAEVLEYLNNNLPVFLFIDQNTLFPIENRYRTPETLGKDRLAAVVEANAIYPNRNLLIIDIGTAITYEFVDSNNRYCGGNISPGVSMRFKALNTFTGKLPIVDRHGEYPNIGYDTDTAIRAGVIKGVVSEIAAYIDEYSENFSDIVIILTGGHTKFLKSQLNRDLIIDIDLVLKGLNRILNYNVEK